MIEKETAMADIRPFRCIHPADELWSKVAALPYDVYHREEARAAVAGKPLLFLNIDRPETQFPEDYDMYAPEVYQKAHDMLWGQIEDGTFVQDPAPVFYIYELEMNGRTQTGITAVASVDDYISGVICRHENTKPEKEMDRIRHISACEAQTGPIFLAYRKNEDIAAITEKVKKEMPVFHFRADDGIGHRGWCIRDPEDIQTIRNAFAGISHVYIADGHHRAASAVKVALKKREENPGYTGQEEFNYLLAVLFPDEELMIMDYNRVIKTLNGLSEKEFLQKLQEKCVVTPENGRVCPDHKNVCDMYLNHRWYRIRFRPEYTSTDPVEGLDVSILQREVLTPILGIGDPRTDPRIDFVGGIRGPQELERRCRTDCVLAFAMYPTSIRELFSVADAGKLMPPKSTWFEPKLRSGLFIHAFVEL